MRVQTEAIQFRADQKLTDFVQDKVGKLQRYYDRIQDAKVIMKLENSGQVRDKIAEIKVKVPGEVFVATASKKTFEAATLDAIQMVRRQIKRHKEKLYRPARR